MVVPRTGPCQAADLLELGHQKQQFTVRRDPIGPGHRLHHQVGQRGQRLQLLDSRQSLLLPGFQQLNQIKRVVEFHLCCQTYHHLWQVLLRHRRGRLQQWSQFELVDFREESIGLQVGEINLVSFEDLNFTYLDYDLINLVSALLEANQSRLQSFQKGCYHHHQIVILLLHQHHQPFARLAERLQSYSRSLCLAHLELHCFQTSRHHLQRSQCLDQIQSKATTSLASVPSGFDQACSIMFVHRMQQITQSYC